jgi:hypothetical protein
MGLDYIKNGLVKKDKPILPIKTNKIFYLGITLAVKLDGEEISDQVLPIAVNV